ncbi:MAG: prepilin peptidase [Candidatus Bathyarchaeota archaeon]|nr:prepilin peptidase [Candidatus Bathyarchaeota archaeon]
MQQTFIAGKVILSLAFLLYASWSDYKTREVSNRVWAIYGPAALLLTMTELTFFEPSPLSKLPLFGLSFGITAVFAIILFYSGGFGGADSKALMCIALALPFSTESLFPPVFNSGISPLSQNLFPLTIFSNSVLFAATSGLYMILRNIIARVATGRKLFEGTLSNESIGKKILVMITGYKVAVTKLKEKWHVYPMEDIDNDLENQFRRKLVIMPRDEGRNEMVKRLSTAVNTGIINDHVWATPGLPMLIFVTIGLIVSLLLGDIVWILVSFVLG